MLRHDGVDQHLKELRLALQRQQTQMLESIKRHFPQGYRLAPAQGGYFLWIELPAHLDAMALREAALESDISVAPGPMFSARRAFGNCLRLNCGHPFTPAVERAIAELGRLVSHG